MIITSNPRTSIPRRANRRDSRPLFADKLSYREKATRNRQQEYNIRSAELDFMLDLETLIKETAADPDQIEGQCCLEDNNTLAIPEDYKHVAKKLTHRWGGKLTHRWGGKLTHRWREHYTSATRESTKSAATQQFFSGQTFEKKTRTCSAYLNAGKNLKTKLPNAEISKIGLSKNPGEEIQIDFTAILKSKHINSFPFIVVAEDKNSRWSAAKISKNTNHDTVLTFLQ